MLQVKRPLCSRCNKRLCKKYYNRPQQFATVCSGCSRAGGYDRHMLQRKGYAKSCKRCGKFFTGGVPDKLYCSLFCRNKANILPKQDRLRQEFRELKSNKPCMDCGDTFPAECMDFDHRPGEVKVDSVTRLVMHPPSVLSAEIAKCDLICANCHRIRTRKRKLEKRDMAKQAKTPKAIYNSEHGGSHLEIQPLDPRQGQPVDLTVPHATDTILPPPLKPGQILPPLIGPVGSPSDYKADPQILHKDDYTRPNYNPLTKT